MLTDVNTGKYYLKPSMFKLIQREAGKNGFAVNAVNSLEDDLSATIKALPIEVKESIIQHLKTGGSPLTDGSPRLPELFEQYETGD